MSPVIYSPFVNLRSRFALSPQAPFAPDFASKELSASLGSTAVSFETRQNGVEVEEFLDFWVRGEGGRRVERGQERDSQREIVKVGNVEGRGIGVREEEERDGEYYKPK